MTMDNYFTCEGLQEFRREELVRPTLKQAQDFVGGLVEVVYIRAGDIEQQMLVNEEGLLKGLPLNFAATVYNAGYGNGQTIVGPVLLLCGAARWD